jgi:8-oxo-dGTP pyrophosphatase MutT (NUDIX family)
MISFDSGSYRFHYRAACIILHDNKVLLQRTANDKLWFIPGGRVELGETAEEALEREMKEEYSVSILNKKLVWVTETFVEFPERHLHELGLYYLVEIPSYHKILSHDNEFIGEEDGFVNKWVHIEMLDKYWVVPEFVVPELRQLDISDKGIKQIVHRSVR